MTETFLFPDLVLPMTGTVQDGRIRTLTTASAHTSVHAPLTDPANRQTASQLHDELAAYFAGELRAFTVPVDPAGTAYQQSVWTALRQIPYGQSRTYGEIAVMLGYTAPVAARAVGNACGKKPILLLTPCHRVFAKGRLGGFSGAEGLKRWLCALERIPVPGE